MGWPSFAACFVGLAFVVVGVQGCSSKATATTGSGDGGAPVADGGTAGDFDAGPLPLPCPSCVRIADVPRDLQVGALGIDGTSVYWTTKKLGPPWTVMSCPLAGCGDAPAKVLSADARGRGT